MASRSMLIELLGNVDAPMERHMAATASAVEATGQTGDALSRLGPAGIIVDAEATPVPMFLGPAESEATGSEVLGAVRSFALGRTRSAPSGNSLVVAASVDEERVRELESRDDVILWPNSVLALLAPSGLATTATASVDCRPFQPGADIATIRQTLGVDEAWSDGFRGDGIIVGIIDEGVDGTTYPVAGGFSRPQSALQPGKAPVTSHGSMCAADVLIAAPNARLYDYPFLGIPRSGGALQMFQAVLDQRQIDGTPHITSNSYGFVGVPDKATNPRHEVHDITHPIHRKIREVVAAGVPCFFAAGNCGGPCPSGNCLPSGIGVGISIHASNSLTEVITVAAVNNQGTRIGYSSQGPGMFEPTKPDFASYSHIFANFGPGRPGGTSEPFDSGTSAATPVAAGVAAMLLSAFGNLDPATLKNALIASARPVGAGWNADFGHGIIDARAAYLHLKSAQDATS